MVILDGDALGVTVGLGFGQVNTDLKQKLHIAHPSGQTLSHVICFSSASNSADSHFPSTISSNRHCEEYELQSFKLNVGSPTGFDEGNDETTFVGLKVGTSVGLSVGKVEGVADGPSLNTLDGMLDGGVEGSVEGDKVAGHCI